jgi:ABC-type branched-subunit amino acid transport system substrate-binding protein
MTSIGSHRPRPERGLVLLAVVCSLVLGGCAAQLPAIGPVAGSNAPVETSALGPPRAAPATPSSLPSNSRVVKVGLLLPLTGPGQTGIVAAAMKKAAELAVVELNAPNLQLVIKDDKGTPEGAVAAMHEIQASGAELVLGPLFARSVTAVAPIARQANLPVLSFSNDRQVAGNGVTLLSFLTDPEVDRVVAYAASKGKRRFMALFPDDAYGRLVQTSLRTALARHGGQLVAAETLPIEANRMLEAVRRLRDQARGIEEHGDPIDVLFLPSGEETLATLAPQLRQAQFDLARLQIIGTGAMDYANAGRDASLVGAWFAAPDPKGWKDFSDRFAKAYGLAPPRIASLAYDAVGVAASLSNGPDGARFIPSQLTRATGFAGTDGQFRLTAEGTTERALAIMEVQPFAARVLEPAFIGALPGAPVRLSAASGLGAIDAGPRPAVRLAP